MHDSLHTGLNGDPAPITDTVVSLSKSSQRPRYLRHSNDIMAQKASTTLHTIDYGATIPCDSLKFLLLTENSKCVQRVDESKLPIGNESENTMRFDNREGCPCLHPTECVFATTRQRQQLVSWQRLEDVCQSSYRRQTYRHLSNVVLVTVAEHCADLVPKLEP